MTEYIITYQDAICAIAEGARIFGSSTMNVGAAMLRALSEMKNTLDEVELVRCRDCRHRPIVVEDDGLLKIVPPKNNQGEEDYLCPFLCEESYYNRIPPMDFYCGSGEKTERQNEVPDADEEDGDNK